MYLAYAVCYILLCSFIYGQVILCAKPISDRCGRARSSFETTTERDFIVMEKKTLLLLSFYKYQMTIVYSSIKY